MIFYLLKKEFYLDNLKLALDGETLVGNAGANKDLDTDDIVKKQSDFLKDQLNNESLLEIFNIV